MAPYLERVGSEQQGLHERDDLVRDRQRARTRIAQEVSALDSGIGPDPENPHGKLPVARSEHRQSWR